MNKKEVMGTIFKTMEIFSLLLCGYHIAINDYILAVVYGVLGIGFEILVLKVS